MTRPAHARSNGPTGDVEALRDDVLLDAAHSGDAGAFGVLRERYHGTALAVARSRSGSAEEAERVAAAALGRVEQIVGEGGGPRAFLGAFVVWMVGREADGGTRPVALPDDPADPTSLVRVFSGLPAEWQAFLWRTEVLGHSARRAAAALGLGAVAAAGLHRDMVRGLRGLYGQAAADRAPGPDCAEFSGELPHFVRGTRGQRSRRDVKAHLDGCARCTAEYLSRQDIGTGLRTWTLPVLAGLPLWGTEALELANLIAGAGGPDGAGAATGAAAAAGAGAAAGGAALRAGTGPSGARPHGAAGASPWSGRRAKVLLGAGALATAVAVAAVSVSGGGEPVPAPDSLAAEQAPRTAEDLQDARAGDAAAGAGQADDDTPGAEGAAPERDGRSSRSDVAAAEQGPAGVPAGALEDGAGSQAAALVAGADRDGAAADAAAAGASDPAGSDAVARPGAGAQPPASAPGGVRSAASGTPGAASTGAASTGAASTGGAARGTSSRASSASTAPARTSEASSSAPAPAQETGAPAPVQEAGTPSPAPSVPSSLPTLDPSPAPLRAPVPPAGTTQPPSSSAGTGTAPGAGRQHVHQRAGGAPAAGQAEPGPRHRGTDWHQHKSQAWKDAGRQGRHLEKGQRGRGGPGEGRGRQQDHSHR
ncbi:zf-HC2 domain-containing protein [Kocuria aegyptia]|uniref:Putative zinc-finger domain-containing protein n=1 Tax=Kocuria aegyptia TaxID=330943 RepID=A0ABN2L5B6_9MICC